MASGKTLMGLSGGLSSLPEAMALGKEISFDTRVVKIHGNEVSTNNGEFKAKHIILATAAKAARELLGSNFPQTLNTRMSPSVHEAILVKAKKRDGSYGTLISPGRNPDFNVITNERFKAPGLAPEGFDLFGILRSREGAMKEKVSGAEELIGIAGEEIIERKTTIWKEAIPVLSPGHLRAVAEYRKSISVNSTVFLAGDYLSTGCAEGAVESGQFVAGVFASRL
jgi:protoporphyrinogen oxidase